MRLYEYARKMCEGKVLYNDLTIEGQIPVKAYPGAILPIYQTKKSAGADFFAAEDTVIPSIWKGLASVFVFNKISRTLCLEPSEGAAEIKKRFAPTLVHTGIKAAMEEDEVLYLYNHKDNPGKMGLVLADGVGMVDSDYYNNSDNDGEIAFAFYNFFPWDVMIQSGTRIGQGVFAKYLRPEGRQEA